MTRDKAFSHKKIVEAAKDEFLKYGFEDASMRRIAGCAGMSVSALYKHFSNKEDMFASLVDPVIRLCMEGYRRMEEESFAELEDLDPEHIWENKNITVKMMNFIYAYPDEFRLIILKSSGTRYESFIHDLALKEEETTLRYMEVLKQSGVPIHEIDKREFHLLVTGYFQAVFETLRHDFSEKEALHYAGTLQQFYDPGWKRFFGY